MTYRKIARFGGIIGALSALALAASMVPAAASNPPETFYDPPTNFNDSGSFNPGCKGVKMKAHYRLRGTYWNLNVAGSDGQAFLNTNKYDFKERWVNAKTGRWMIVSGSVLFQEVSATQVDIEDVPESLVPKGGLVGPIYLFEAVEAGNPSLQVTSSTGRTVVNDSGVIYYEQLFDTLGDQAPGGKSLRLKVVKVEGDADRDRNLCKIAKRLTA